MGDLSNYEIYKIAGLAVEGYVFSIQEETNEEPTFDYYMVTIGPNRQPVINKLNNTIEILSTNNLELIPVNMDSPEIQEFINLIQSTMKKTPIVPLNINNQGLKLSKTQ